MGGTGGEGGARTTRGLVTVCTVEARLVDVGLALLGFGLACVRHAMTPIAINATSRSAPPSQRIPTRSDSGIEVILRLSPQA